MSLVNKKEVTDKHFLGSYAKVSLPVWPLAFSLIVLPDRGKTQNQPLASFAPLRFK